MKVGRGLTIVALLIPGTCFLIDSAHAALECHLHLPGSAPGSEVESLIIRSVGKPNECEQLNQQDYAGKARCHCSFTGIRQDSFVLPPGPASPGPDLL